MARTIYNVVAVVAWLAAICFGVMWIRDPNGKWEPIAFTVGVLFAGVMTLIRWRWPFHEASAAGSTPAAIQPPSLGQKTLDRIHDEKVSELLSDALIWAKQIGDSELEKWCRLELYGYTPEGGMQKGDEVPEYRRVDGRWISAHGEILDLSPYPDLAEINRCPLRWGAKILEDIAAQSKMQSMTIDYAETLFRKYMGIENLHFEFHPIAVRGTLDTIKNRLAEKLSEHS